MALVVLSVIGIASFIAMTTLIDAWVVVTLWRWFIVPAFAASPMTMGTAIGVDLLVNLIHRPSGMPAELKLGDVLTRIFLVPVVALGIGWVVHALVTP